MCLKEKEIMGMEIPYRDKMVILSARAFVRVGMYAYEQSSIGVNEKDSERSMHVLPAIVNLSLSSELYLKSYLSEEQRKKDRHYLDELFKHVPETIQKIVISQMINKKVVVSSEEFQRKLQSVRKVFVEWRYYYELTNEKIDLQFLATLTNVLAGLEAFLEDEESKNDE